MKTEYQLLFSGSISKNRRGAALGEALREATKLLNDAAKVRPDAKNVLVVITDKKSDSRGGDLKKEAMKMRPDDIKVIAVALGEESDKNELDILTPEQDEVIEANSTDGAKKTAEEIMDKALEGKI